ncbi:hypothetical protein FHS27_000758 [Rhodopirellula rubra]|uniref:Uncharacterized protein n=1 Tax=Aporhodopirellula rubra TaxID=980271 RepID=A0A7W5DUV7_9BACT|nr:hypothetical protein [Aporhodopirellula rubra]MBB3204991.1 hypothetical protein [Aporhodopirellula rubra]
MALDYIQPAVQVRKVAKLLELVTIRVKRGEIPETLESSREIEETGLEISPPSVITVSRGDCFATGKTVRDELSNSNGDPIERTTTRGDRDHIGAGDSTNARQEGGEKQARHIPAAEHTGGC